MLKEDRVDYDFEQGWLRSPPRQIFLELTGRCNLACVMCPVDYGAPEAKLRGDLPFEVVEKLEPWLRSADSVNLNVVGEPLLYPRFDDVLDVVGSPQERIHFNTNGLGLTNAVCQRLVERQIGSVVVSVDGLESNDAIRGVSYQRLRRNILRLLRARESAGASFPKIGVAYTLMARNLTELPRLLEDLLPHGVDGVHLQPLVVFYEKLRGENVYDSPAVEAVIGRCRAIAARFGADLTLFRSTFDEDERNHDGPDQPQLGPTSSRYGCVDPFYEIKILHTGEVQSCSFGLMSGLNLNELSLEEVWNHAWYRALRSRLSTGTFEGKCERCPLIFGSKENQAHTVRPGQRHSREECL